MRVTALDRAELDAARALLDVACAFDRAAIVAEEKLFGDAPAGAATAWAVRIDAAIAGVAVTCGTCVRVLAVAPAYRGRGVGSALLAHAEDVLRATGTTRARLIGQPGNFLAPGLDERDAATRAWLARRGWVASDHRNVNLLVEVRGNPRVSAQAVGDAAARLPDYRLRRATLADRDALTAAVEEEFGGSWPFEIARALEAPPGAVHVAEDAGGIAAFAVHDGNNRGLGWFGPAGTWPSHRSRGVGEALLLASLVEVAADHQVCEVAWIGPRAFYQRAVGIAGERRFVPLSKEL